jgi:hypothetical protein
MAMSYSYELQAAVYDYMEELDRQKGGYLAHTINELQHIVASARQFSDEDSSDAGLRLRKRQDDLVLLERGRYLVKNLSQLPLNFGEVLLVINKTKAALQSCQCHYENRNKFSIPGLMLVVKE